VSDSVQLPRIVRFWVDETICIAQRRCVQEAPDLMEDRNVSGGPFIQSDRPANLAQVLQILNAAWVCPVAAFKVELDDGSVRDSNDRYLRELGKAYSKNTAT
jgi:ferredoxin